MTVGKHEPARGVAVTAQAVPAAPPSLREVVTRGARLGLGIAGLARGAVSDALARPAPAARSGTSLRGAGGGTVTALVPGAVVGLGIAAQRQLRGAATTAAAALAGGTERAARTAARVPVVRRGLDTVEDQLWRWNELARREQHDNRAEAAAALPLLVQHLTESVLASLDVQRLVEQIPVQQLVDSVVARIDIDAVLERIDVGEIIRESTVGVTAELTEELRVQAMSLDGLLARAVDRALLRRRPRDLDVRATAPTRARGAS